MLIKTITGTMISLILERTGMHTHTQHRKDGHDDNGGTFEWRNLGRFSMDFLILFFLRLLLTATPVAYGSSQAWGRIRAIAEVYATVTATLDPSLI